ncbi:MAG: CRISPR-associated helicase Cas3' [Atribacterota bacterium]
MKIFSHPQILLSTHLKEVAKNTELKLKTVFEPGFIKLAKEIALLHDIGKATKYFQEYLKETDKDKKAKLKNKKETNHSLLSALITLMHIKTIYPDNILFQALSFYVVRMHHSNLKDFGDALYIANTEIDVLKKQITNIYPEIFKEIKRETILNEIDRYNENLESMLRRFKRKARKLIQKNNNIELFYKTNIVFSAIIDSDKLSAAEINIKNEMSKWKEDYVDKYYEYKGWLNPEGNINRLRSEAYNEVCSKIENINNPGIYSINLPTGMGKTLTAFSFALKLREKIRQVKGYYPKIIYSLPFTSIIDQNFEVFAEVFQENNNKRPYGIDILKHHYMSEAKFKNNEENYKADQEELLVESWNSDVVVTTFVQFFHTLVGYKNRMLKKLDKMPGSIIILDEIQNIPPKYWKLINKVLTLFATKYNCYIIYMTATMPAITERSEIIELINSDKYFELKRYLMNFNLNEDITIEEFCNKVSGSSKNCSKLVVLNTIGSAEKAFEILKEREYGKKIAYLSTWIVPKHRTRIIDEIRNGKYKIVVSTQLVEAGVDIDLDVVYRDIAPLDSIHQVAGRCNRNFKNKTGEVKIFSIKNENNRLFSSFIYDPTLIGKTKENLTQERIDESEIYNISEKYFYEVKNAVSENKSNKILNAVEKLQYDRKKDSVSEFKLIEQDYEKNNIFVEIDDNANEVLEKYLEIKEIKHYLKRKKEFLKIKNEFYDYVLSIPVNKIKENCPPKLNDYLYFIPKSQLSEYYDKETGDKAEPTSSIW